MRAYQPAPLPDQEAERLRQLHDYQVLDTPAEPPFDDFTVLASRLLNAPIALISLIDHDRQWFKSKVGLDVDSTPRDIAFCSHAILQQDVFVVEDALQDDRFADNPLVQQDPRIRFYAGSPLITPSGQAIGTLCVIDRSPRRLSADEADTLKRLSRQLVHLLQLRKIGRERQEAQAQLVRQAAELQRLALVAERTHNVVIVSDAAGLITWVNPAFERVTGYRLGEAIGRKPGDLLQFEGTSLEARQQLGEAVRQRQPTRVQILNRGKHGNVYWMDVDLQPLHEQGRLVGFVAIETDITDLIQRQSHLLTLFENLPTGLLLLDAHHQVRGLNSEARRILAGSDGMAVAEQSPQVCELLQQIDTRPGTAARRLIPVRTGADESRWLDVRVADLPLSSGDTPGCIVAFSDQTEQIRAGRYLELAAQTADVSYWTWDLARDILEISDSWRENLGLGRGRLSTKDLIHPDDQRRCQAEVMEVLRGRQPSFRFEERLRRGDGSWCWVLCGGTVTERDAQGRATHLAGIQLNIDEEKRAKEALQKAATTDPLTELPNRLVMLDRLNRALSSARRRSQYGAVLYLDLDHFKRINDTYGHSAGDLLLKKVAERLRAELREEDTLARMGGDEMMVLLPLLGDDLTLARRHAQTIGHKLIAALRTPLDLDGVTVVPGTSIGITLFPKSPRESAEDLVREADTAMYGAKAEQRGSVRFYEPEMHQAVTRRLQLEHDLRQALDERALEPHIQGKWSVDQRLVGGELLLRWAHPVRGWVPPTEFIAIAEESDLIQAIGRQVLEHAVGIVKAIRAIRPDFVLSVNISPKQFARPDFLEELIQLLREAALPPDALLLEITEGVLLQEHLARNMIDLSERGFRLSLDDFGTGYSSLAYLKRLPVHEIKIDRAFVRDIEVDANDAALVQAILAIAQRFGIRTAAEGVETSAQLAFLAAQGCDLLQGYHFDRPQPWEAFVATQVGRGYRPA